MKTEHSHAPRYIYGIDFGTSNSALAVLDTQRHEVVKLFTVPSVLFFPDDVLPGQPPLHFVGNDAVTRYVESERKGRFMKSVKRVLPNKSFEFTRIHGKKFTADDLVALIIAHLKREADLFLGETVTTAVIGRPVVFDEHPEKDALAQDRLGRAVRQAGIETAFFQLEPIGAAFTYERQLDREELVLVADFGGGTSDFTVMKLRPDATHTPDRQADMIAKGGIYIGGDNFDSSIMWEKGTPHFGRGLEYESRPGKWLELPLSFFHNICSWEKMNFFDSYKIRRDIQSYYHLSGQKTEVQNLARLIGHNLGYSLFQEIEKTKKELSRAPEAPFGFHQADIDFDESITLEEFEQVIIRKDLDKTDAYLHDFLAKLGIAPADIDTVFMTGGTSLVRPVRTRFINRFGAEKIKSGDNFHSVAIGLAYSYALFSA